MGQSDYIEEQRRYWEITYHRKKEPNVKKTTLIRANSEAEASEAVKVLWRKTVAGRFFEIETVRELDALAYLAIRIDEIERRTENLGAIYGMVAFLAIVTGFVILLSIFAIL